MSAKRTIAIVGAGFCGTTVAINLLRMAPSSVDRLLLVERVERQIGGIAYSTTSGSHTLNVPAGRMSAFEDDPDDFLRFVRASDPSLTGGSFVPRRTYGEYLATRLDEARRVSPLPLIRVAGEVVAIAEEAASARLTLGDGRVPDVDQAVLAIGNFPPADPQVAAGGEVYASLRYARDPWSPDALELDRREDVLLLGTGLTMCDVALALRDLDHRGRIYAVSRRGLLPQPHRVSAAPPPHLDAPSDLEAWPDTAIGMLRALRREVRDKAADAVDWREVVTSVRADTPALWQRLDVNERRRFLERLRPYWETHRHRSSPETAFAVESLIASGALDVIAGRVERYAEAADAVVVTLRRRGSRELRRAPRRQDHQLHRPGHRPGARERSARPGSSADGPDPSRPARPRARHGRGRAASRCRGAPERVPVPRRAAAQGAAVGEHRRARVAPGGTTDGDSAGRRLDRPDPASRTSDSLSRLRRRFR